MLSRNEQLIALPDVLAILEQIRVKEKKESAAAVQVAIDIVRQVQKAKEQIVIRGWLDALPKYGVVVILGHRGEGKSALGWSLMEMVHKRRKLQPVVLGLPRAKRKLTPAWVKHIDNVDTLPEKAVVLIDEAALRYRARRSQSDANLLVAGLMALSRQRKQLILFIAHTSRMLDVEMAFDSDLIIYKLPSAAHVRFERKETAEFTKEARDMLLLQKDPKKWAWVVDLHHDRKGLLRCRLPRFWSEALSNLWAGMDTAALGQLGRRRM